MATVAPSPFRLAAGFSPRGDQPSAIEALCAGVAAGAPDQVLLGVTGSGKTFTAANVIARTGLPTIVISHNKTLAAQLYAELREFFPENAVEYFVSYYDYYQPEAYIPQRDIYIEKDASINEKLDRLRLSATSALMTRRDVIVVASVSCLYGLGSPAEYQESVAAVAAGGRLDRDALLRKLVDLQYERNDYDTARGMFRARGDVVEIHPAYEETALRIEFFGDTVERILRIDPVAGTVLGSAERVTLWPAKHFVASASCIDRAVASIQAELRERTAELKAAGKLLEAERLLGRTRYDIELLREAGYCPGIENYSRHLDGRGPGERPFNLFDYFTGDFLTIVDESHVTVPQLRAMHAADRSRKQTLVDHGFRLPSALDNRPMTFEEWEGVVAQTIYVSATPGPYELEKVRGAVVNLVNRPTGLLDPIVVVRPARGQVGDLLGRIRERVARGERTLVTTLTKRMAEDLSEFIRDSGVKCEYLHSEIDTFERVEILQNLRKGVCDVVVGVNLLREGLDLPEVSLVAIMDADKEGFLRSETALIQTIGRAARNDHAEVVLYGDVVTPSMDRAIGETRRRRGVQERFNREHGIAPRTIVKAIRPGIERFAKAQAVVREAAGEERATFTAREEILALAEQMQAAAARLDFEQAAVLRDRIAALKRRAG
ncbi:MAG TPA: excinuclease ABC subunit UvrB [Planctomycetota bacterium]|nr:excinuclease ABC subunit UvrB [Planctomycetota bacterium]OQC19992.1 MAG: UvrABC system protein B [Planctomycetes bacterium ADurb.Bin069]HNR99538.1 excinuclease ABC subunit UvrB [Planctomycetota bacterium]HNU26553.1 excinuclease ABC subunit UvrB [Planctomycetota bacterium]HOE30699.1 excinuclease ABC subunit UvrB [Planctomycetota bacterium]